MYMYRHVRTYVCIRLGVRVMRAQLPFKNASCPRIPRKNVIQKCHSKMTFKIAIQKWHSKLPFCV